MEDSYIEPDFISLDDQKYEFSQYCNLLQQFKIDLQSKKVAIAKFGGPIAICRDISQTQFFESNDIFKDHIWFYSNEGLILNKIKFSSSFKIVGFDFIYEELLVVVLENGLYYLINPFEFDMIESKRIEEKRFSKSDDEYIVEAKILKNGLGFFTRSNKFYIMNNVLEGKLIELPNTGILSEISSWDIVPQGDLDEDDDAKFNLYIANSSTNGAGVLCLSENFKEPRVLFNGQNTSTYDGQDIAINLRNIRAIASDWKGIHLAFLTQEFVLGTKEQWTLHMVFEEKGDLESEETYYKIVVENIGEVYAQEMERLRSNMPSYLRTNVAQPNTPLSGQNSSNGGSGQNSVTSSQRSNLYQTPKPKINMYWIEDKCVVIEIRNTLFMVGKQSSSKQTFNDDVDNNIPSYACTQEIDGVKILAENRIYMLRHTPEEYLNIFDAEGNKSSPGRQLYAKSQVKVENQDFDQQPMSQTEDIFSNQAELERAVDDCIIAGAYEFDVSQQQKLLKAASHGRILLQGFLVGNKANIDQEEEKEEEHSLTKVCKLLRVVYQLNQQQKYTRSMTYAQIEFLFERSEIFLKILLRYNYHYIAIEISKFLRLDIHKEIYVHWACCKIEKNEDDDKIIQDIKKQFKDQTNIPFTDIIQKALKVGKAKIVLELLNFEPSIQKRIPVLLHMAKTLPNTGEDYFYKALSEALQSKDSNLIFLVIKNIWNKFGEQSFDYFSKEEILSAHFQQFLRTELDAERQQDQYFLLYKFLNKQKQYLKAFFSILELTLKMTKIKEKMDYLQVIKKEYEQCLGDRFYIHQINDKVKLNEMMHKQNQFLDDENAIKYSVNQQLKNLIAKNQTIALKDLTNNIKIHDKAVSVNQLKLLIESDKPNSQEIIKKVEEINGNSETIPYSIIIDQLTKKNLESVAFMIAMKIKDEESRTSQYERVIRQCYAKDKDDELDSMSHQITNEQIRDLISELRDKIRMRKKLLDDSQSKGQKIQ